MAATATAAGPGAPAPGLTFNIQDFIVPQCAPLPPPAWYRPGRAPSPVVVALAVVSILALTVLAARLLALGGLRRRLAAAGWVLYTQPGCGACRLQLELLGGRYPNHVECDAAVGGTAPCSTFGAFPTWRNSQTGATLEGAQDPATLARMLAGQA